MAVAGDRLSVSRRSDRRPKSRGLGGLGLWSAACPPAPVSPLCGSPRIRCRRRCGGSRNILPCHLHARGGFGHRRRPGFLRLRQTPPRGEEPTTRPEASGPSGGYRIRGSRRRLFSRSLPSARDRAQGVGAERSGPIGRVVGRDSPVRRRPPCRRRPRSHPGVSGHRRDLGALCPQRVPTGWCRHWCRWTWLVGSVRHCHRDDGAKARRGVVVRDGGARRLRRRRRSRF